jgi:hypothetical protein
VADQAGFQEAVRQAVGQHLQDFRAEERRDADRAEPVPYKAKQHTAKIRTFKDPKDGDWANWLRQFRGVVYLKRMTELDAKVFLMTSMADDASLAVQDIECMDHATLEEVIEAYTERFLPAESSAAAKSELRALKQTPGESVLAYHARTRVLF